MSDSLWPHGLYIAHQAPLSMGFSRQEYWSGLPFPSPGDLPDPGVKPRCPTLQADFFTLWVTILLNKISEPVPPPNPNTKWWFVGSGVMGIFIFSHVFWCIFKTFFNKQSYCQIWLFFKWTGKINFQRSFHHPSKSQNQLRNMQGSKRGT